MRKLILITVLAGILGNANAQNNSNATRDSLMDPNGKDIVVTAHRGDWHGTAENSLHSIRKAVEKGAGIALMDLQRTADGELVLFSDPTLDRLTDGSGTIAGKTLAELRELKYREFQGEESEAKIPTLKEALSFAKGKILIEVEPGEYLDQVLKEAAEADALEDIIILNPQKAVPAGVMSIAIVDLDGNNVPAAITRALESKPIAIELRFKSDDNAMLPEAIKQIGGHSRICFNTLKEGLSGSHVDTGRNDSPDTVWGSLIRMGGTIIVSDQIKPLLRYLNGEQEQGRPQDARMQGGERPQRPQGNGQGRPGPDGKGPDGVRGPQRGGGRQMDKPEDPELKAMIAETVGKFKQFTYKDEETGKEMNYNLFIPENYDPAVKYPMIMFIGDASTVRPEVTAPLTQGYGGIIWATAKEQAKHPCFVLVPQYTTVTVSDNFSTSYEVEMTLRLIQSLLGSYSIDKDRLYTTGQSMGGMMSMYFNLEHPDFFAAALYAGCQWDTSRMAHFAKQNFFYVVAAGDPKASVGMAELKKVFEEEGAPVYAAEWSAKLPEEEQYRLVNELLETPNPNYFVTFTLGTVLAPDGSGHEHMSSFDYVYKLEAVRDWLFRQSR